MNHWRAKQPTNQVVRSLQPLGLSPSKLVTEQEQDMEILSIKKGALSEIEAERVPVCYFVNSINILMRKWRPLNVPASNEWCIRSLPDCNSTNIQKGYSSLVP